MENHNWYAVITVNVLRSKDINDKQKLLVALISNLSNEKGYCFASNKYLGGCLDCSEHTIRHNLSVLENKGFLGRVLKLRADKTVEFRTLTIIENPNNIFIPPSRIGHPPAESQSSPPAEISAHNNKVNNNKEEYSIVFSDIIACLNKELDTSYKSSSKKTQSLLFARIKEGFKSEQIKNVIYYKKFKWINDEKMSMYLRPETLFGNKLESYINEMKMDKSYQQQNQDIKEYSKW
jgi:uncharacterized phage protein (TIGR02220 family)